MNAILRDEGEATVLTIEGIEIHLSYLRPAVEALTEKLDQADKDRAAGDAGLGEKIDAVDARLCEKIDASVAMLLDKIDQANKDREAGDTKLDGKIDASVAMLLDKIDQANKDRAAGDAMLAEKIEQANKDRAAGDAMLSGKIDASVAMLLEKIDSLGDRFRKMQASLDGIKWFVSSLALLASVVSIAHSLGWL